VVATVLVLQVHFQDVQRALGFQMFQEVFRYQVSAVGSAQVFDFHQIGGLG
jgi:hypothetical protein